MGHARARRRERRKQQKVDLRSDEEREIEDGVKTSKWTDDDQTKLESKLEAYQAEADELDSKTFIVCEDCLRIIGCVGTSEWKNKNECDLCGSRQEFCIVYGPNDNLELGDDVYDYDEPQAHVCNVCSTNWRKEWHEDDVCGKCMIGSRIELRAPSSGGGGVKVGNTTKVCSSCETGWIPRADGTTCFVCGKGGVMYRIDKPEQTPPVNVPSRGASLPSEDRSEFEPYRTYVPNHETGRIELISGPPKYMDRFSSEQDLYKITNF